MRLTRAENLEHGIPPCSTPTQRSSQHKLYQVGPIPMRLDATTFIPQFLRFRMHCFDIFVLTFFDILTFRLWTFAFLRFSH